MIEPRSVAFGYRKFAFSIETELAKYYECYVVEIRDNKATIEYGMGDYK